MADLCMVSARLSGSSSFNSRVYIGARATTGTYTVAAATSTRATTGAATATPTTTATTATALLLLLLCRPATSTIALCAEKPE